MVDALLAQEGEVPWGMCLHDEDWHEGVIGLVAARIRERHHRPVIAFARGSTGELKGSARSIPGLHIRDAIAAVAAAAPQLVARFGGHAGAAGLTIAEQDFSTFARVFDAEVRRHLRPRDLEHVLETDGELAAGDFTLERAELLREAGPWGQHFPEPLFDGEFLLRAQRTVGERHLRLRVAPHNDSTRILEAIAFGALERQWPDPLPERLRLAYRLDVNEWQGLRTLQLVVEEIQPIPES